jgi:hypothetical protein
MKGTLSLITRNINFGKVGNDNLGSVGVGVDA